MAESSLAKDFRRFMDGDMKREIEERVDRLLAHEPLAGSDYDTFGSSRDTLKAIMPTVCFLSRCYFRTETHGLEKVAAMKRALIIPNHMTPAPVDGMNICSAFFLEPEPPACSSKRPKKIWI